MLLIVVLAVVAIAAFIYIKLKQQAAPEKSPKKASKSTESVNTALGVCSNNAGPSTSTNTAQPIISGVVIHPPPTHHGTIASMGMTPAPKKHDDGADLNSTHEIQSRSKNAARLGAERLASSKPTSPTTSTAAQDASLPIVEAKSSTSHASKSTGLPTQTTTTTDSLSTTAPIQLSLPISSMSTGNAVTISQFDTVIPPLPTESNNEVKKSPANESQATETKKKKKHIKEPPRKIRNSSGKREGSKGKKKRNSKNSQGNSTSSSSNDKPPPAVPTAQSAEPSQPSPTADPSQPPSVVQM
ncbi:unnamed protein product, partial [Mesorhabditis belari]|uniref:Uncharacterized protein n=1 Tax=Mesorhabditis belari TaxID=2138241 RepID=A0AAF3F5I4_9BILA